MKSLIVFLFIFFSAASLKSQNTFRAVIKDKESNEPLAGVQALIENTTIGNISDPEGNILITGIPSGRQVIMFRFIGYEIRRDTFSFPLPDEQPAVIFLLRSQDELGEIIVEGTRSNRSIENIPTRVEVLTEEIDEAATMDPSKVAHLLTHSTGIQVQQTSATSNTSNVRIQGLDGRYTQILKDGFPLYGGFSGSLSIMQIPPLDLRQIEYIKGSASTLYGGGAIAGLINLISKEPGGEETLIHLNASSVGAFDVNTFISRKMEKAGFTLLAQRNTHLFFDADADGFTDLPELTKYNVNPKLFFYPGKRTKLSLGATLTSETREGGDIFFLKNKIPDTLHFYHERNDVDRSTVQLKMDHTFNRKQSLTVRNSFCSFHRDLQITPAWNLGEYRFAGTQRSTFSEITWSHHDSARVLITGMNFYSDDFREEKLFTPDLRDERHRTTGAFSNITFDAGKKISIESGIRADYVFEEKIFLLPRISVLLKWTQKLTTRVGGGMGYRNASIFNQEAELLGYRDVLAIDRKKVKPEESYGGNIDIGYKTPIGEKFFVSFNQMFFYSRLDRPLALADTGISSGVYHFINANGYTQSKGAETFFKFGFFDFVFFAGYTYTDARNYFGDTSAVLTLTPKHSLKGDLLYSLPGKWRIGVDYEYKSAQRLSTGKYTRSIWTFGAVVEYTFRRFTFFGNVENFTGVRQTKYESLRSLPWNTPQFTEIWAPLDGMVVNGGIKVRL